MRFLAEPTKGLSNIFSVSMSERGFRAVIEFAEGELARIKNNLILQEGVLLYRNQGVATALADLLEALTEASSRIKAKKILAEETGLRDRSQL